MADDTSPTPRHCNRSEPGPEGPGSPRSEEPLYVLVMDVDQVRPACALLQAALRGDRSLLHRFESSSWLTGLTDSMQPVAGTMAEWEPVIAAVNKRFPGFKGTNHQLSDDS